MTDSNGMFYGTISEYLEHRKRMEMVNTPRRTGAGGHVGPQGTRRPTPQPKPQPQPTQQNPKGK